MLCPRDRYQLHGPAPFSDAELLALMLGTPSARNSSLGIATTLLQRFGDLHGLANAELVEILQVQGIGIARATRLHAGLQAGRRSLHQEEQALDPVVDASDAYARLSPRLRGLTCEELHGLYLDRRQRPVALRTLTRGSDRLTVVDARQIFRIALAVGAASVILAHNHPSGNPYPSDQDIQITRQVVQAGRLIDVPLLDHLVIAGDNFTSIAEWDPWETEPSAKVIAV